MEIDLERSDGELEGMPERLRSRVCIVGGGIAGLILAQHLSSRFSVTLLEAGGRERSAAAGDPFCAELQGMSHAGTREGRVCALGGCSLTWGGQLLALPEDAGWAIPTAELREASADWFAPLHTAEFLAENGVAIAPFMEYLPELTPRLSRFVGYSRRNLARQPGRELLASERVKVVLHACVREVVLSESRYRVQAVEVVTPAGVAFRVEAEQFVLAAGTVETCRLLLASQSVAGEGIGNAYGQVGRNFNDHLTVAVAEFTGQARTRVLEAMRPWILPVAGGRRAVHSLKLEASAKLRAELGLNASMAHLTIEEPETSGVGALRAWLRSRQSGERRSALSRVLPMMVFQALRLVWEARVKRRRYVSPEARVRLQINMAQDAPSASHVGLSAVCDAKGMPKARVDWRISTAEIGSMRRFAAYLKERLEAIGWVEGAVWDPALLADGETTNAALLGRVDDARHAMGGACMGTDPRSSVVDPDLRVHGVTNLSIASAAVFPDGSAQLPTLTLQALCVRLAARLGRELV